MAKSFLWVFVIIAGCHSANTQSAAKGEIIYHVFQRSFYDSNGDLHGDLNGLRMKLDYLQELGVTSILLLPLYESVYYHNYFAVDFKKIDPEFGSVFLFTKRKRCGMCGNKSFQSEAKCGY